MPQFYAAITEPGSPVYGLGNTPAEALHDAQGDHDTTKSRLPRYTAHPCSAALYDRVTDIGPDVVYVSVNGRLVLPGEI